MVNGNDEKAREAIRHLAISCANKLNQTEPGWHYTTEALEDLIEKLMPCLWSIVKVKKVEQDLKQSIQNVLKNFYRANSEFIKQMLAQVNHINKQCYESDELIRALIQHIQNCQVLNRTPEHFEEKVLNIIQNYLADGELVNVLLGQGFSPRKQELLEGVRRYFTLVARRNLSVKESQIEDLIQDTWAELLTNLKEFHFLSRFLTWGITILYRKHYSQTRHDLAVIHGGSQDHFSLETPLKSDKGDRTIGETIEISEANPEEQLISKELYLFISKQINELQEEFHKPIGRLALLEQMKPNEIAKEVGIDSKRVSAILFRIREILRANPTIASDYGIDFSSKSKGTKKKHRQQSRTNPNHSENKKKKG